MKLLPSAPLTQEDWSAWLHARHGFLGIPWAHLVGAYEAADRRDAELMLRQSYVYPGAAVISVDCGDTRITHVIVGRLERERYALMRDAGDITNFA